MLADEPDGAVRSVAAAASRSSPDAAGGGENVGSVGSEASGGIESRAMIPVR